MKNSLLAPLILGGVVVVAVAAYAGTRTDLNPWQDYADVVSVVPAFDSQQTAREDCNDEAVTQQVPIKDEKRVAGTAIGAVIGGVLGNQVGSGDGKKLATAAGAVAGGYAGSKTQKHLQERQYRNSRGTALRYRLRQPREFRPALTSLICSTANRAWSAWIMTRASGFASKTASWT